MFANYFKKSKFYDRYMQLYAMRQAIANLQMEDNQTELLSPKRTHEMYNNVIAFDNILSKNPDRISPYDLIDIADDINTGIYTKGFRKTQVDVKKATNFYPPSPSMVPQAIYSLFNNYHNVWTDLPVYLKEAMFHIELVRIQPFEDGNKRSSRILTNYNLCKQNKAPVVIAGYETDEYFGYIDNYDADGMAAFLRKKSNEEFEILLDLYRSIYGDSLVDDPFINLSDDDVKIYVMAKNLLDDIGKVE